MIDKINKVIIENWDKINPGKRIARHFRYLLIHGYSNVIIFVFSEDEEIPLAVVKIDRFGRGIIAKEHRILVELKKKPFINESVAIPLEYLNNSGGEYIIETALPGICLSQSKLLFKKKALEDISKIITNWLIRLRFCEGGRDSFIADESLVSKLYNDIGNTALDDKKDFDIFLRFKLRLRDLFEKIEGENIPFVLQHGDFWPGNILLDNNKIGVVDWDGCVELGFPLCDIIDFFLNCSRLIYSPLITRYFLYVSDLGNYIKNSFFDKGLNRIVTKYVNEYCRSLKINTEVTKVIFLWHLVKKYKNLSILDLFFSNERKFLRNK